MDFYLSLKTIDISILNCYFVGEIKNPTFLKKIIAETAKQPNSVKLNIEDEWEQQSFEIALQNATLTPLIIVLKLYAWTNQIAGNYHNTIENIRDLKLAM